MQKRIWADRTIYEKSHISGFLRFVYLAILLFPFLPTFHVFHTACDGRGLPPWKS